MGSKEAKTGLRVSTLFYDSREKDERAFLEAPMFLRLSPILLLIPRQISVIKILNPQLFLSVVSYHAIISKYLHEYTLTKIISHEWYDF